MRLPSGSWCLMSFHPSLEEVLPSLNQAQKHGQGSEILCHWFSPCQSLVQFSLCPIQLTWHLFQAVLQLVLCRRTQALRGCYRERMHECANV